MQPTLERRRRLAARHAARHGPALRAKRRADRHPVDRHPASQCTAHVPPALSKVTGRGSRLVQCAPREPSGAPGERVCRRERERRLEVCSGRLQLCSSDREAKAARAAARGGQVGREGRRVCLCTERGAERGGRRRRRAAERGRREGVREAEVAIGVGRAEAHLCGEQGGSGLGQLALRSPLSFSAPDRAPRLPRASASLGQSATWAALAGHIGLLFSHSGARRRGIVQLPLAARRRGRRGRRRR